MAAPKLAIDFGTSRTKVAYYDESAGKSQLVELGEEIRTVLPSIFYIPKEGQGERLVGDEAKKMVDRDPEGIVLSLKKEIHKMGKKRCGPDRPAIDRIQLAADLFRYIHKRCRTEVFHDEDLYACRLTVPSDFKAQQREAIRSAAQLGGFREVAIVEEPVAAAQAWLLDHAGEKFGNNVVVCDVGGGTTDFAFLKFTDGRFEADEKVLSDGFQQGGSDVDELILEKLWENNSANEEMQGFRAGFLLKICQGRELISRTKKSETPISVNGYQCVLSRSVTEEATAQFVELVKAGTQRFLEKIRNQIKAENAPILLVGGASKLPGLSDAMRSLNVGNVYLWNDSDYATVLGAVEIPTARAAKTASQDRATVFAEAVKMAATDGKITPDEVLRLKQLKKELELTDGNVSEIVGKCLAKGKNALIQALNTGDNSLINPPVFSSDKMATIDRETAVIEKDWENEGGGRKVVTEIIRPYNSHDMLLGTYAGKCKNNTLKPPVEADVILVLKRIHGREVVGDLSIFGNLGGGSDFSGVLNGEQICFVTRSSDKMTSITWTGNIVGDTIEGNYIAVTEGFFASLMGMREQKGVWQCKKSGC